MACCTILSVSQHFFSERGCMARNSLLLALATAFIAFSTPAQDGRPQATPPAPPPPVVSPQVHSDNRVVFRLRAPNAKEVAVSIEGSSNPLPLQKDEQGVWSVTSDPLA